jgi:hypothetical protein
VVRKSRNSEAGLTGHGVISLRWEKFNWDLTPINDPD